VMRYEKQQLTRIARMVFLFHITHHEVPADRSRIT
jgi:hypothetical protein